MEAQLKNMDYNEVVYHYEEKIAKERKLILDKVAKREFSKRNADFIFEFVRDRKLKKGFSNSRICKLLNKLKLIALVIKKDFDKWDKPEAEAFLEHINNRNDISKATKVDYLIILKVFFKWLKGNDKVVPEFLADIKATQERKRRLPSEILTEEDLLKMVNATSHPRNKALISLMFDSGVRVGELINLKMKNLIYDNENKTMRLIVETGKTGARSLILIPSVPYINQYINSLPKQYKENPNSFLFLALNNGIYENMHLTRAGISMLLNRVSREAKVNKPVNPHAFRRASAVNSAGFMTDSMLMVRYGWSKRETINAYVFMNPSIADEKYKEKYGIKKLEFNESILNPIRCVCGAVNAPDSVCANCGRPNTLKIAIKTEEKRNNEMELLSKIGLILSKALQNSNPKEAMEIADEIDKLKSQFNFGGL